ncbi:MAG: hypothetical protein ABJ308_08110 [Halieaceae bacterium]
MMHRAIALILLFCSTSLWAGQCRLDGDELMLRPAASDGPTEVSVRVYVNDLISIHDVDQSFIADVLFRADWRDPRLAHSGAAACTVQTDQVWTPVLQLLNRRHVEAIRSPQLAVASDGSVTFLLRSLGEFSFKADLTDFPFDRQELSFNIVSTYGEEDVSLLTRPEYLGLAETLSVANWDIEIAGSRHLTQYVAPVDKHLVRLDLVLDAARLTGYYTWQQLLPLFLVVMMTWVVFWIPLEFVPPRVGLAATSMLTLIAYRFAMSSVLPPIAYLTRLDIFMIGASVLVFVALATAVAVTYIDEHYQNAQAAALNRSARWLSPLGLLLVAAIAFYA